MLSPESPGIPTHSNPTTLPPPRGREIRNDHRAEFNERLTAHCREAIAQAGTTKALAQLRVVQTTLAQQWSATSSWLAHDGAGTLAESTGDTLEVLLEGVLHR